MRQRRFSLPQERGFTLIELLVVVVIMAIISALAVPAMISATDKRKKASQKRQTQGADKSRQAMTSRQKKDFSGPPPRIDFLDLKMSLTSSYHRIGMKVHTRYKVKCQGKVGFGKPQGLKDDKVLLFIPFPQGSLEARNVKINLVRLPQKQKVKKATIRYHKGGVLALCPVEEDEKLQAEISFVSFGRERFEYSLPPAQQLKSLSLDLKIDGAQFLTIPDHALQPTSTSGQKIEWNLKNLVSDRQISVLIPGTQSPLARVLLLLKLVAVAVLLFGAGFWFLSEQAQPGQLDDFRLGHFLLLALTYSLFFAIFAVLEFHGQLTTLASLGLAALFSIPLLVFHISRILNLKFALTRVLPLTAFTLGIVLGGVYGGPFRDYIFTGAAFFVVAYLTLSYESWVEGVRAHKKEKNRLYNQERQELVDKVQVEMGEKMAEVKTLQEKVQKHLESRRRGSLQEEKLGLNKSSLVDTLNKDYQNILIRLENLPFEPRWEDPPLLSQVKKEAEKLEERLDSKQSLLREKLDRLEKLAQESRKDISPGDEKSHCTACGKEGDPTPFCQHCGAKWSEIRECSACEEKLALPLHLIDKEKEKNSLYCFRCGHSLE